MTARDARLRHLAIWAACVVILAGNFTWLGLTLAQNDADLPFAYWAVGAAACLAVTAWGLFLPRTSPAKLPDPGISLWEELRQSLQQPDAAEKLLDGMVLASHPLKAQPIRLREVIQASIRRCASPAFVHEGGDPHVVGDAEAIGYVIDALLSNLGATHIELKSEGRTAEVAVRGSGSLAGISIVRRLIEDQNGELLMEPDSARIRLPLLT